LCRRCVLETVMAIPIEILTTIGVAAVAVIGAAAYSYLTGRSSSVDLDDDGNDEIEFGGKRPDPQSQGLDEGRIDTSPSPAPNTDNANPTGGPVTAETSGKRAVPERLSEYDGLEDVTGIGPSKADDLREAGLTRVEDLYLARDEDIADVDRFGSHTVEQIRDDLGGYHE